MKVYLDDMRPCPEGWVLCRWPDEVIKLLQTGEVCELSLDHDLGDDKRGTGYDVVKWIKQQVYLDHTFPLPDRIMVHSQNPVGARKMRADIQLIYERRQQDLDLLETVVP